ncbi:hypothetical protein FEM48_Zijuj01G0077400 [Ziziphus jujuba var. spinosa]|uniref:Uncharacterized protein n=1 Tax=Ziziphus jujuba var. spinosa TaxID=714518 RepID=A0A978W001_ZIZJJ|nr:hypothetical protein FEM48_Zijuj01G0077400 [Ziziphus jujuba var. spinosa]
MEGVGARLGRSSTRYGPATVFNGPVRKWKKTWVHVSSPSTSSSSSSSAAASNTTTNHSHHHHAQIHTPNGTTNGNNVSHLVLYKWTPITQSQNSAINGNNTNNGNNTPDKVSVKADAPAVHPEEPPRRKFKYIPGNIDVKVGITYKDGLGKNSLGEIAVLEEQKNEAADDETVEKVEDEGKPNDTDLTTKGEVLDEKPDINDVPMEETQENNQVVRQDLNETLDLSLGLNGHDGENNPDSKTDQSRDS